MNTSDEYDIGMIGLGAMGASLALNLAEQGYSVAGHDLDAEKVRELTDAAKSLPEGAPAIAGKPDLKALVGSLRAPRKLILLLPAGKVVDRVLEQLFPLLEREDIVVDAGNSHYRDTERRIARMAEGCIHYLGMGVSGGPYGARHGPSLMPGGSKAAWEVLQPALEAIAAKAEGKPCAAWLGRNGAGHFVKMVHNGIEYGIMELIAESYDLLKRGLHIADAEAADIYEGWSKTAMGGYLLEITASILRTRDPQDGGPILDKILDAAGQKGTGAWTSQTGMELQVPTPVIDAAVAMRALSDYKSQRKLASQTLPGPLHPEPLDRDGLLRHLEQALDSAMLMAFVQGLHLIHQGAKANEYGTSLADVVHVWRDGCIIRSRQLEDLAAAYRGAPNTVNPLLDGPVAERLSRGQKGLRQTVETAARLGIPVAGFAAALGYYDAYRSAQLPANLVQAQRDYFGTHGFERVDAEGSFHGPWA